MAGTDSSAESPKHSASGPSASHCSPHHSSDNVDRREHTALADACTTSTLTATATTLTGTTAIGTGGATATTTAEMMMSSPPTGVQTDADGLILPKKLINPYLESSDRKQLQRELKFNNKVGKSVLNQKSELQRAYEKQRERQLQHQQQQQQQQQQTQDHSPTSAGLKGELSRVIMERAQKVESASRSQDASADDEDKQYVNPEYLNVRAKLRTGQRGSSSGGGGSGGGSGGDMK